MSFKIFCCEQQLQFLSSGFTLYAFESVVEVSLFIGHALKLGKTLKSLLKTLWELSDDKTITVKCNRRRRWKINKFQEVY